MGLLKDCEEYFGSKDLYEIFAVDKGASENEIKRSFRRLSLKYHPDRHNHLASKELRKITEKFQILSKICYVLNDKEKRALYDSCGTILDDDVDNSNVVWEEYWRCLFPEITAENIDEYMAKYIGSNEEREDLKAIYLKYKGNMDYISQSLIGFDEDRTRALIEELIKNEELPAFEDFVNEPKAKIDKRRKRAQKEAKQASQMSKKIKPMDDLTKAIRSKNKKDFDSLVNRLAEKYINSGDDEEIDFSKPAKSSKSKEKRTSKQRCKDRK